MGKPSLKSQAIQSSSPISFLLYIQVLVRLSDTFFTFPGKTIVGIFWGRIFKFSKIWGKDFQILEK